MALENCQCRVKDEVLYPVVGGSKIMQALIHRFVTTGVAASTRAADALFAKKWRSSPCWTVCPSGIDRRPFPGPIETEELRAELGIRAGAVVVGHVGRFVDGKNSTCFLYRCTDGWHNTASSALQRAGHSDPTGLSPKEVESTGILFISIT